MNGQIAGWLVGYVAGWLIGGAIGRPLPFWQSLEPKDHIPSAWTAEQHEEGLTLAAKCLFLAKSIISRLSLA